MGKIYFGHEETARAISELMGNTHDDLIQLNLCNEPTLQAIATLLGTADDTGGTVDSGTLFAKMNAIKSLLGAGIPKKFRSPTSIQYISSGSSYTTINGKGVAWFNRGDEVGTIGTIYADGTKITTEQLSSYMYYQKFCIEFQTSIKFTYVGIVILY